jgi:hypothetical protein
MRRMHKKPSAPPQHRHYPRTHPIPVRPGAAPRPAAAGTSGGARWSRAVPEGRRFPRGA